LSGRFLSRRSLAGLLVGLVEDSKPFQPRIVALKEGRGELFKILFKLGKKCRKKKTLL
jgi:hypothetical protein